MPFTPPRPAAALLAALIVLAALAAGPVPAARAAEGLAIAIPAYERPAGARRVVVVRSVVDKREFQDRPRTADVPSLAMGLAAADDQVRRTAIGRERNGYGKAMRNVFLEPGRSVEEVTTRTLAAALAGLGCEVRFGRGAAPADSPALDVEIQKFWGWVDVQAGFLGSGELSMVGEMKLLVRRAEADGASRALTLTSDFRHRLGWGVTRANWLKTFDNLLKDFVEHARENLPALLDGKAETPGPVIEAAPAASGADDDVPTPRPPAGDGR